MKLRDVLGEANLTGSTKVKYGPSLFDKDTKAQYKIKGDSHKSKSSGVKGHELDRSSKSNKANRSSEDHIRKGTSNRK